MPVLQPVYRTGSRQRSIARNLIAGAQQPAQHVQATTEVCEGYASNVMVVPCRSQKLQQRCGVTLVPDQLYHMVRSRTFVTRWYLVTKNAKTHAWTCSSRDERTKCYCVSQVVGYRLNMAAKKAA